MKILILDSITLGDDISLDKLKELGEVITYPQSSREEAKQRITEHNPEVIITNKVVIDEAVLSGAPAVKMIAETATGYNNIDLAYAKAHGITVANVAGYSTQSVIQHTFALCFYLLEKLSYYDNYVKSGAILTVRVLRILMQNSMNLQARHGALSDSVLSVGVWQKSQKALAAR